MLVDLVNRIDRFVEIHTRGNQGQGAEQMKADLLELVQKAVEHGEGKDQNKIVGILTKVAKTFWPGSK